MTGSTEARERDRDQSWQRAPSRPFADLGSDLRQAVRSLRNSPSFTAAVVLTLALGLGATTVIFSVVDHVVLRPLAYRDPGQLVVVREVIQEISSTYPTLPANASHFLEWQRQCRTCVGLAALRPVPRTLTGFGDPQQLAAVRVSANLFSLLGVEPALGRTFRAAEDEPGGNRVVILSDALWHRQFGGDPSIIGRAITLDDAPYVVVGVLPRSFRLPKGDELGAIAHIPRDVDAYVPLALTADERTTTGAFDYSVIARLEPGASIDATRAQLDAAEVELAARSPDKMTLHVAIRPLEAQVVGAVGRPLLLLLAAVVAMLCIVCVNVASLSLARSAGRLRESAVRVALGAGRGRLVRHALTESMVLALAGGLVGVIVAHWGLRALIAIAPASLPRLEEVQLDARVFAAAALLSIGVGIACGILPALRLGAADPGDALKAGGRTATRAHGEHRRRAVFIGIQAALSTVLLVGTGLFLVSFVRVLGVDKGFATDRVVAIDVVPPRAKYTTEALRNQFYDRVLAEIASLPGVRATAVTSAIPLTGESQVDALSLEHDPRPQVQRPIANIWVVSPGYFAAMGAPVRRGRAFGEADRGRNVVVLSERAASALWPGENPIGKRVVPGDGGTPAEVVGVVADVHTSSLEQAPSLVAYVPYWSGLGRRSDGTTVVVRTTGDPAAVTPAVRAAVRRVDPIVPVTKVRTMAQVVSASVAERRFELALLMLFAVTALATAAIGIYGVISHSLARRSGEIAVRMALGAAPAHVRRLVLREGLTPVALGLVAGLVLSLVLGRAFGSLLFEVHPSDPLTMLGVTVVLGIVAAIACYVPARRATAGDLVAMLRLE